MNSISPSQIRIARGVALMADLLQIGLFPLFGGGFISPLDDILDVVVFLILTSLLGWHFVFLPSFIVEVIPLADLIPTWTMAVFLVTRQQRTVPSNQSSWTGVTVYPEGSSTREQSPPKLLPDKG